MANEISINLLKVSQIYNPKPVRLASNNNRNHHSYDTYHSMQFIPVKVLHKICLIFAWKYSIGLVHFGTIRNNHQNNKEVIGKSSGKLSFLWHWILLRHCSVFSEDWKRSGNGTKSIDLITPSIVFVFNLVDLKKKRKSRTKTSSSYEDNRIKSEYLFNYQVFPRMRNEDNFFQIHFSSRRRQ